MVARGGGGVGVGEVAELFLLLKKDMHKLLKHLGQTN